MKLLLAATLICALLCGAVTLRCHVCDNSECSNTTSVVCPATHTICKTITTVKISLSSSLVSLTVNKNCSLLLPCSTPLNTEVEWSVNRGFSRESHTQICCMTDNCNFQTLAVPNPLVNGKECPSCASSSDSLAGTCNATLPCMGVEDSCFNGTTTLNSTKTLQLGCISRNLCTLQPALQAIFGEETSITCGAPWNIRVSSMLLIFALSALKYIL